jgi:hypothetical protein
MGESVSKFSVSTAAAITLVRGLILTKEEYCTIIPDKPEHLGLA